MRGDQIGQTFTILVEKVNLASERPDPTPHHLQPGRICPRPSKGQTDSSRLETADDCILYVGALLRGGRPRQEDGTSSLLHRAI